MRKKMQQMRKNKKKGFTLVELIVVIAILAILAAVLVPALTKYINDATEATGKANARGVYSAASAYVADKIAKTGACPGGKLANADLKEFFGEAKDAVITATVTVTDGKTSVSEATWKKSGGGEEYTYPEKTPTPPGP